MVEPVATDTYKFSRSTELLYSVRERIANCKLQTNLIEWIQIQS